MEKWFTASGGLALKAESTKIQDSSLRACRFCSFDEVGALTSGRGRAKANNGNALGGSNSLIGGFDGYIAGAKYRWIKRGAAVYTNGTAVSGTVPLTTVYTTSVGAMSPRFVGGTAPTFSTTGYLSGFCYNGYAYMADGQGQGRYLSGVMQTWGLVSPGYHTGDEQTDPLACNNAALVTVTLASGHGFGSGIGTSSYPFAMNVELVGMKTLKNAGVDVIPDNEVNCLHYGGSGAAGDIAVTSSGSDDLHAAAVVFSITYQNGAGAFDWQKVNVQGPAGGATPLDHTLSSSVTTHGSPDPATDSVQTIYYGGTPATQGYFTLKVSRGGGDYETTGNIPYNATVAQVRAALEALSFFTGSGVATYVVSVTGATTFTFQTPTTSTGGALTGGGSAWFIRQGPTLAETTGGALVGGTYYYAYTFYNGVAESNFSAQVPIAVATGAKVTLTNVMKGPVGTTVRRIYRTDVDGRQLYFVGEISDNSTFTFTDTARLAHGADFSAQPGDEVTDAEFPQAAADRQSQQKRASKRGVREATSVAKAKEDKLRKNLATNLGLQSGWTSNDPPPANAKHVGLVGDTCFFITGSELGFSDSGNPEHCPLSNRIKPARDTSEGITTWLQFDRDVIVYTPNALYRLTQVGLDFSDCRFEEIETPVGCAAEWGAAALDGLVGHLFLSPVGVMLFDGARVQCVSDLIEPLFMDPDNTDYMTPNNMGQAVMVTSRDRLLLAYRHGSDAGNNNRLLFGDFADPTNPSWSLYDWEVGSVWREKSDNTVLAGDSGGYVWALDYLWSDDGSGTIDMAMTTKEYPLCDGLAFRLEELLLDASFAGVATTITVTTRARGNTKTATFTNSSTGRQRIKVHLPNYMKGEVAKIAVSSSSDTKRVVYGWGFTYQPMQEA